jgi:2'-5' RNA ligase
MRLFVSVDLDGLADGVADAQARLPDRGSLRPVDPADAHVTLKFLGEVDPDRLGAVEDALATAVEDAGVDLVEMAVGGVGVFPLPPIHICRRRRLLPGTFPNPPDL